MLNISSWTSFGNVYINYTKLSGVGITSDCIECEMCIEECSQIINIPNILKDVALEFENEIYNFKN